MFKTSSVHNKTFAAVRYVRTIFKSSCCSKIMLPALCKWYSPHYVNLGDLAKKCGPTCLQLVSLWPPTLNNAIKWRRPLAKVVTPSGLISLLLAVAVIRVSYLTAAGINEHLKRSVMHLRRNLLLKEHCSFKKMVSRWCWASRMMYLTFLASLRWPVTSTRSDLLSTDLFISPRL